MQLTFGNPVKKMIVFTQTFVHEVFTLLPVCPFSYSQLYASINTKKTLYFKQIQWDEEASAYTSISGSIVPIKDQENGI